MDGEAGWWTTSGNIGLPPLARVMGVGRQQQGQRGSEGKRDSAINELKIHYQADGNHIRARAKWIEECEKSTSYFFRSRTKKTT